MLEQFTSLYVWRPYRSLEELTETISNLRKNLGEGHSAEHAVPFSYLPDLKGSFPEVTFGLSSMNDIHDNAFTRNIAAPLLHDAGAKFVLIGTALNRNASIFDPTLLPLQIREAAAHQVTPRLCIGENYSQYSQKLSKEIISSQLKEALVDLSNPSPLELIYEASWIDESPFTPTLEEVCEAYKLAQTTLQELYPDSKLKIFCKVPRDVPQKPDQQMLPADGFYFS